MAMGWGAGVTISLVCMYFHAARRYFRRLSSSSSAVLGAWMGGILLVYKLAVGPYGIDAYSTAGVLAPKH